MKQGFSRLLALALCSLLCLGTITGALAAMPEGGLTDDERRNVLQGLPALVFPVEQEYYSLVCDLPGCRGNAQENALIPGFINSGCTNGSHAYQTNDGLDIAVPAGSNLYAVVSGTLYAAGGRIVIAVPAGDGSAYYYVYENVNDCVISGGEYVQAGSLIGHTAGSLHILCTAAPDGRGNDMAWDAEGLLSNARSAWKTGGSDMGLYSLNPGAGAVNSITGYLQGSSAGFPAPVPAPQPDPSPDPTPDPSPVPGLDPLPGPAPQPEHTHSWNDGQMIQEATHTQPGVMEYTCICGEKIQETIPTLEAHAWQGTVIQPASHSSAGVMRYDCPCGASYEETIPASGGDHAWDAGRVLQEATHSQNGLMEYTCACGATYQETIPMLAEHAWDAGTVIQPASHAAAGIMEYRCICGEIRQEPIPALGGDDHVWNDGEVIQPATHTAPGVKLFTCPCGATYQEPIPASADHVYDQQVVDSQYLVREADCSGPAQYAWSCICGAKGSETFSAGAPADHTYASQWSSDNMYHWHAATCVHTEEKGDYSAHVFDEGTVTKEAGHMVDGERLFRCTVCGASYTEPIHGETHSYTEEKADSRYLVTPATCDKAAVYYKSCKCGQAGSDTFCWGDPKGHTFAENWSSNDTQHWKAATCGHDLKNQVNDHIWNAGVITTEPTSTSNGIRTYTCQVCSATRTEIVPPSVHRHTFSTDYKYNEYGHWQYATCGDTNDIQNYSQHTWNGGVVTQNWNSCPTVVRTCLVCGMSKTESQHNFSQQVASAAFLKSVATCTSPAVYYVSCACGQKGTETFTYGGAVGHTFAGTYSHDASYHWRTCTVCGTRDNVAAHSYSPTGETCITCGFAKSDGHVHTTHLTRVPKKEATCTVDGNINYYTCSCGRWFTDTTCTQEITDRENVIIRAVGHIDSNNDGRCDVCRQQMTAQQQEYRMLEGAGSTWMTNSNQGLVFRTEADFYKFDHVEVDGATITGEYYTVSSGSTIVELKPIYLKRLAPGDHKLSVVSNDGRADTTFSVKQSAQKSSGGGLWLFIAILAVVVIISAIGIAVYLYMNNGGGDGDGDGGFSIRPKSGSGDGAFSPKPKSGRKGGKYAR